ncbi:MAG: quinolinate synthase NadA [Candidatus Limnocylindrales bacterium]
MTSAGRPDRSTADRAAARAASARSVPVEPPGDLATFPALQAEIRRLAREKDAVILAHSYERPEVQDVADQVGDSLRLSRLAASAPESTIVFCGVAFMAETAKILSPDKRVLLPDLAAGCSLADSITVEQLRNWKAQHPGAIVVSYVNTTAAVKAESDYCCTSGNARAVIEAIPADRQILFLPDMFLGLWLQRVTGRKLTIWLGECHVHAGIRASDVETWREAEPQAELLIHPECGCTSQIIEAVGDAPSAEFGGSPAHILSTEGMVTYAERSNADSFLVATEVGILHRLEQKAPGKRFTPVSREAVCQYMKLTTLEKVRDSLLRGVYEIEVPADTAAAARLALERMIAIS